MLKSKNFLIFDQRFSSNCHRVAYDPIENNLTLKLKYARKIGIRRLGLTAFSKIYDFVKNVRFPATQQIDKEV